MYYVSFSLLAIPCEILSFNGPRKKQCFVTYLSCICKPAVHCSSLQFTQRKNFLDWNDTGLKLHEVRLLNKCSKIYLLECFLGPLTYCPASDKGLLIGLWMSFIVLNCQLVEWVKIVANPVFKNPGIYWLRRVFLVPKAWVARGVRWHAPPDDLEI